MIRFFFFLFLGGQLEYQRRGLLSICLQRADLFDFRFTIFPVGTVYLIFGSRCSCTLSIQIILPNNLMVSCFQAPLKYLAEVKVHHVVLINLRYRGQRGTSLRSTASHPDKSRRGNGAVDERNQKDCNKQSTLPPRLGCL